MCRFFKVSRSGYYDYVKRMENPAKDLPLAEKIRECQDKCGKTYGYRRVHIWLERNGIHKNPKTVLRVMQKYNLLSVIEGSGIVHMENIYIGILIYLIEISRQKDRIKNGLRIFRIYTPSKVFCIYPSLEIYSTTVSFRIRPEQNKTLIWF